MRYRHKRRVDWDEELRKTENIRRKGLFISALGFGVSVIFIFGASRMSEGAIEISRKIIFTFCFMGAMFVLKLTLSRRERLKRERQAREQELEAQRMRREWEK
jgi:hypothetical protein